MAEAPQNNLPHDRSTSWGKSCWERGQCAYHASRYGSIVKDLCQPTNLS